MQFEAHSDRRSHHLLQEVQVNEDPLVFGGDAEVAFKQGVEAVQERLQTSREGQRFVGGGRTEKVFITFFLKTTQRQKSHERREICLNDNSALFWHVCQTASR